VRPTADLVKELERIAPHFTQLCLVVKFEKRNERVWAADAGRQAKLDSLMASGGEPIGMLGYLKKGNRLTVSTKPLQEYATESWAREYLKAEAVPAGRDLIESGIFEEDDKLELPPD